MRTQHATTLKPSSKVHSSEAASSTSPTRERPRVRRAVSTDSTLAYRISTLVISYYELPPAEEAKARVSPPVQSKSAKNVAEAPTTNAVSIIPIADEAPAAAPSDVPIPAAPPAPDSTLAYRISTLVISYYELPHAEEAKAPTSSPTRSTGKRPLSSRSLSSYQI